MSGWSISVSKNRTDHSGRKVKCFSFPKDEQCRKKWFALCSSVIGSNYKREAEWLSDLVIMAPKRPLVMRVATSLLLVLILVSEQRRSFVQTAPASLPQESTGGDGNSKDFDEVKQLEELKSSLGKTFSLLKSHSSMFTDVNGQREGHSETREEVSRDGQLVARVHEKVDSAQEAQEGATPATRILTEVEMPERGVHKTLLQGNLEQPPAQQPQQPPPEEQQALPPPPAAQEMIAVSPPAVSSVDITENNERRSGSSSSAPSPDENNVMKYMPYSGAQYSPLDMAEYVFWTGDERGVTLAIEEFLQEGLMTREEAINFLQEIKYNLDFLQNHYAQQRLHKQERIQAKERAALIQKALAQDKMRQEQKMSAEDPREGLFSKKSLADMQLPKKEITLMNNNRLQQQNLGLSDEDYEELLERLRVADFLYTEYSLEEVIYQLAKVMFAQSLNRGNDDAQEALQKFTNFLESEAEQGHISRSLEKKVLDVLIASLADTLSEHPHLVNAARQGLGNAGGNKLLHQLLLLNPAAVVEGEATASSSAGGSAGGSSAGGDFSSGKTRQKTESNKSSTNKSNKQSA